MASPGDKIEQPRHRLTRLSARRGHLRPARWQQQKFPFLGRFMVSSLLLLAVLAVYHFVLT